MIKKAFSIKVLVKIVSVLLLLVLALLSIFVISKYATKPENYKQTIASIDEKKATVMTITAAAAASSGALALIPGDATTPIANKVMDIGSYLLIVVCVLVLEKSLLTVMGYLSFNILIPIACALFGIYVFIKKETLKTLAIKLIIFALVIVFIIPFGLKVSDMIYEANKTTIEQVAVSLEDNPEENNTVSQIEPEKSSWLKDIINKAKEEVSDAGEKAKQVLNNFIDAVAIFIIAYCAIPIIMVLLVVWIVKLIFGVTIPKPNKENFMLLNKLKKEKTTEDQ